MYWLVFWCILRMGQALSTRKMWKRSRDIRDLVSFHSFRHTSRLIRLTTDSTKWTSSISKRKKTYGGNRPYGVDLTTDMSNIEQLSKCPLSYGKYWKLIDFDKSWPVPSCHKPCCTERPCCQGCLSHLAAVSVALSLVSFHVLLKLRVMCTTQLMTEFPCFRIWSRYGCWLNPLKRKFSPSLLPRLAGSHHHQLCLKARGVPRLRVILGCQGFLLGITMGSLSKKLGYRPM